MRLVFLPALLLGSALAVGLHPYGNARFNFWVHLPAGLVALPPPDNADGQQWRSRDGLVRVSAWGSLGPDVLDRANVPQWLNWTIRSIREQGGNVTYSKVFKDAFVISGHLKNGDIYYQKTLLRNGTAANVRLDYPVRQRATWDALVGPVAASLKWGQP